MMVAAFAAAVSHPLAGQRLGAPVERPPLREAVDTNDAQAYFDAGLESFDIDPERAAAAFYWAARLNPAWGEPLYARRAALLMTDTHLMRQMFERNGRSDGSPEVRRLDSLQFRALMLAPFLYRRLDQRMFMAYMRDAVIKSTRGGAVPNRVVIDFQIEQYLRQAGPLMRAWVAYGGGNFTGALDDYAFALSSARDKPGIHLERGRIFGMRGQVDSAVAEMQAALAQLANEDRDKLVVFYESKAMAEYSIGTLLEGAGNTSGAKEAYGQALQEDLAYYPAHLRMGLLALGMRDTTAAMSELALAADLAAEDPHIHYVDGYVLTAVHHREQALAELKAIELEPYYALPYLTLGQLYEEMSKGPEALAAYEGFLAHASQSAPQREFASRRISDIKEFLSFAPSKP